MKYDMVYEWTIGEEGKHDSRPVMLSEYLAALEDRVGPSGQNQIRVSLGLRTLPVVDENGQGVVH